MAGRFLVVALVLVARLSVVASPAAARPLEGWHTDGSRIVDGFGHAVRLVAANWYGAESGDFVVAGLQRRSLPDIVQRIRWLGFNAVRLPWSNEMLERNPVVPTYAVAANPQLQGQTAMQVFDQVVRALTAQGLMVILDDHNSDAEWCCGDDDNDLWYNRRFPESSWMADWEAMAARFQDDPLVLGVDLRNEPRIRATWGGSPATDWRAAAERAGNAVLAVNARLLVFVEGVNNAADLSAAKALPVRLRTPHKVVYEAHDYGWYEHNFTSYHDWLRQIRPRWGYLATGSDPRPLWLGEFGTCNTSPDCITASSPSANGFWFGFLTTYLRQHRLSWAYWSINGTQATGTGRTWNAPESYGVLDAQWNTSANPALTQRLKETASSSVS